MDSSNNFGFDFDLSDIPLDYVYDENIFSFDAPGPAAQPTAEPIEPQPSTSRATAQANGAPANGGRSASANRAPSTANSVPPNGHQPYTNNGYHYQASGMHVMNGVPHVNGLPAVYVPASSGGQRISRLAANASTSTNGMPGMPSVAPDGSRVLANLPFAFGDADLTNLLNGRSYSTLTATNRKSIHEPLPERLGNRAYINASLIDGQVRLTGVNHGPGPLAPIHPPNIIQSTSSNARGPPSPKDAMRRKNANSHTTFKTKPTNTTATAIGGNSSAATSDRSVPNYMSNFHLIHTIGRGTYGKVYKAQDLRTLRTVAVKRIRCEVPLHQVVSVVPFVSARNRRHSHACSCPFVFGSKLQASKMSFLAREPNNLTQMQECDNVIRMLDRFDQCNEKIVRMDLVFEYCPFELRKVIRSGIKYQLDEVKCFMRQILSGVHFMHRKMVNCKWLVFGSKFSFSNAPPPLSDCPSRPKNGQHFAVCIGHH